MENMSNFELEICVDSIESAKNAIAGGATRLEVCSSLSEGGLTPTPGLVRAIKKHAPAVPIYAMIRARPGNFVYTREEMDAMLYDLEILKNHEVDGFVFGALTQNRHVDEDFCREIVMAAEPKPVTFHRAFDEAKSPLHASMNSIIDLGFKRILTSGQEKSAPEGTELLARLVFTAGNDIIIVPGSGINPSNIQALRLETKAKEFHASARIRVDLEPAAKNIRIGDTDDGNKRYLMVTSQELVRQMVDILKTPIE